MKLLEVIAEENGRFDFSTELDPTSILNEKDFDARLKKLIRSLVECFARGPRTGPIPVSSAIRLLSMAEIIACAQPYSQMEELWSHMMFETIPHYEKYAEKVKKEQGIHPGKVIRPQTIIPGTSAFPLGKDIFS